MIETGSLSPTEPRIHLSHVLIELITHLVQLPGSHFFRYSPEKMIPYSQSLEEKNPLSLWLDRLSDSHYPVTCSVEICMAIEHGADRSPLARDRVN